MKQSNPIGVWTSFKMQIKTGFFEIFQSKTLVRISSTYNFLKTLQYFSIFRLRSATIDVYPFVFTLKK